MKIKMVGKNLINPGLDDKLLYVMITNKINT